MRFNDIRRRAKHKLPIKMEGQFGDRRGASSSQNLTEEDAAASTIPTEYGRFGKHRGGCLVKKLFHYQNKSRIESDQIRENNVLLTKPLSTERCHTNNVVLIFLSVLMAK